MLKEEIFNIVYMYFLEWLCISCILFFYIELRGWLGSVRCIYLFSIRINDSVRMNLMVGVFVWDVWG